jgi:hypothetical protein
MAPPRNVKRGYARGSWWPDQAFEISNKGDNRYRSTGTGQLCGDE